MYIQAPPAMALHLIPMDLSVWGTLKDKVTTKAIYSGEELFKLIMTASIEMKSRLVPLNYQIRMRLNRYLHRKQWSTF